MQLSDSAYSTPQGRGAKLLSGSRPREAGAGQAQRQPWWFGPRRLLALFCYIMFLCYLDNGLLASNGITGTATTAGGTSSVGYLQVLPFQYYVRVGLP